MPVPPNHALPESLLALAAAQAGVLSRGQILSAGLSRRVIAGLAARWWTLGPGVYQINRLTADEHTPWQTRLWAGLLVAEPNPTTDHTPGLPCIGGLAAAVQHGLVERTDETSHPQDRHAFTCAQDIDVFVAPERQVRSQVPGYRFVRCYDTHRARHAAGEPLMTGIDDTVLDVLDLGSYDDVADWIDRACQRRLTTPKELLTAAARRRRLKHRRRVFAVLDDQVNGVTSALERIFRDEVERPHGLPKGRRQVRDNSRLLDCVYESLVVELDGKLGHVGAGRWRDRRRDNAHTVRGRPSLRYGWQDCTCAPCEVAWEIGGMLVLGGWEGRPTSCPNCPPDLLQAQILR